MTRGASNEAVAIVERYLEALGAFDWGALEDTLSEDLVRIGPYGDRVEGRSAYAAFLRDVVSGLPGYALEIKRVRQVDADVLVELAETIDADGGRQRTEEALVFSVDPSVRIAHIEVYIQSPRAPRAG